MPTLRTSLLAAAASPRLRQIAERSRFARPVVDRFVAGSTEVDAMRVTRELVSAGLLASLDFLGERTTSAHDASRIVEAYCSLLACLRAAGLADRAEVSVKLSAVGQALQADGDKLALENARLICASAAEAGTMVTIDMEDHTTTDSTLRIVRELRIDFQGVGVVLQAYLRRTESDCRDLATAGSRIRLCKGAYAEPGSVAFEGDAVSDSYIRCLEVLMGGDGYPMVATHDPVMISAARAAALRHGRQAGSFEFQMLYGIRPDEQRAISAGGDRMRVYVPYGDAWYGYFMRRLAERPANLMFLLRSLRSKR